MTDGLEQIALNAIRWRADNDNDGKAIAQADRRRLLRYIDRHADAPCVHCGSPEHIRTHARQVQSDD